MTFLEFVERHLFFSFFFVVFSLEGIEGVVRALRRRWDRDVPGTRCGGSRKHGKAPKYRRPLRVYSWSSVVLTINGVEFKGIQSISFDSGRHYSAGIL